ncbi:DRTGG domain-containing protein [Caldisalinibacter kiritimatiensis]|uniref:DRTGG domain-containing protein n=1 Tax=Caldisalinibacter kiritimatiensis TaxID=1304284 RepID=R1CC14_9FIRM|nr:DRTGG domain-containing protein [Caldisalinibacter kiritimatiensis]EOC99844.1 DRTGG domain-containing protein [Caldisalinibacter kiritimatiensis]
MKLVEIKEILNAEVLVGEEFLQREVISAFGSDLMSDVLAFVNDSTVLLTGLTNLQVIRTAEMVDLFAIVFVRGKMPSKEILKMAKQNNITIMKTDDILYTACGKLYSKGLKGVEIMGEAYNE